MPADSFEAARLQLARTTIAGDSTLRAAFTRATEISAHTLHVERVGVWLFERGGEQLHCVHQFTLSSGVHTSGEALHRKTCEVFAGALEEHRIIVAQDVRDHAPTRELAAYFLRHRITSLLDAPIFRSGDVVGVVCHEHVGSPRTWTDREVALAGSLADIVAQMFESAARHQAEEKLRKSEGRLMRAKKLEAIGLLAGGVAHDFNNLLTIISGNATLLLQKANDLHSLREGIALIATTAEQGAALTRRVLSLSRNAPRKPVLVDVDALVTSLVPLLSGAAGPSARIDLAPSAPGACVRADPLDIERVLINLVTNSRDAMPSGGTVSIRTRCERLRDDAELPTGEYVVLELSDTGVGMSPEVVESAFEPLFTTKPDGKGTGLGLAIVATVVHESNGAVRVESAPGKGSRFSVFLPRASA